MTETKTISAVPAGERRVAGADGRMSPPERRSRLALAVFCVGALVVLGVGCSEGEDRERRRAEQAEAELAKALNCADESTLLASTTGSPDRMRCSNARHRIEYQVVSAGSEEVGSLVVCRCAGAQPDGGSR